VSLAELKEKHQKAVENITQLETEKSDLTDQVETLREAMEKLGNEFSETYRQYGELMNEREREHETHRTLQAENEEMKILTANHELLKDSLAKSEGKLQESVETVAQLDAKNSKLEALVMSLREAMQHMQNQLSDAYREREKLNNEQERERQAHSILLQAEKAMMKTLTDNEELLKVSIDELGKKHQKAVENITQLEIEKSRLIDQVVSLQDELCENQKKADNLTNECERERESHSILQSELNQAKDDFKYFEKNMTVSLAELKEKHQKAVENISQLETEKSDLTDQVKTLREAMEKLGNEFSETYRQCGELMNEREHKVHRILQAENNETKTPLTANQELLKDSLAEEKLQESVETVAQMDAKNSKLEDLVMSLREAMQHMQNQISDAYREREKLNNVSIGELKEKHQKAVENITQLEIEKSRLNDQVASLQDELCESHIKADNLTNECERERESHSILQSELNQTKDDFKYFEKNMTISLAELEEKHQKALENITQLETEKSDLIDQVETLREAMEEIGSELSETYRQYGELMNDSLAKSEEKLQKSVETISQLDAKNSKLEDMVMSQRETIEHMQNQLSDACREHEKLMKEREREADSSLLQAEKEKMKTLTHNKELLKVAIDELGEKHQKAVENITQLEIEKSRLIDQVASLQDELCKSQKKADNLTNECEREREFHSILQSELNQAKDDLKYFEKNMTVSLAELEEKHQKAVKKITQLETEKSDLTDQVETLREAMEEIGNELSEAYRQYGELMN
ncbi:paramyosin-like isoform X1, partial [Clarias magur]